MPVLNVGGLASGIDTKSLVEQLLKAERAPARIAEQKRAQTQARLDAVKQMNTRLLALRDALDDIKQTSAFAARRATSSNESILTASAAANAVTGSVTVNVKQLASAHQVVTAAQASATTALGSSGTITIQAAGASSPTVVAVSDYSLNGIASAINAANAGVVASVVNDGSGYRLLVSSTKTGAANGITTLSGSGDLASLLPGIGGLTQISAAQDAQVRLGDPNTGLLITSASNTMDQAVPGVTLNLRAVGDGVQVTVARDAAAVRATVQKFVDAFNEARSYLANNSRYDTATKKAGPLFNDYDIARQLQSLERELIKAYDSQPLGFQRLSEVGVRIGSDGKMTIDAATFDAKLAENQQAVASLFAAAGGAASQVLESLTRSVDGVMALKSSNLEADIKALNERISDIDARLERRRAFYQAKFLQMEKLTAQFQAQGSTLANFANSLSASASKKS
ncbi:MAG: flagellar filament capping protein FliD [Planctomycetota bacterium]|nr:flagellar filament capping protein FliD [Planctomycetota bacterium]